MYGDFSQLPGHFAGQYSSVLAQQGRLLLDAELNEQNTILLDYLRGLTTDLVGPFAGPVHGAGFAVDPVVEDGKCRAVRLSSGHYYVYGLRCQAPAPDQYPNEELPIGENEAPVVVYLVVWEQSISAIQAPELIDPALAAGIPDTTRRRQVKWRPHACRKLPTHEGDLTELGQDSIVRAFHDYNADQRYRPTLGARANSGGAAQSGPETAPTSWGYRGVENQLYRVEIHRGGDAEEATFKWSRDNGSVEFGIDRLGEPDESGLRTATLRRLWYDERQSLEVGDWVEFVDDQWAPFGTPGPLMQVQDIKLATRQVTLQDTDGRRDIDTRRHPLLRRWDQHPDSEAPHHGIPLRQAYREWFGLEDGVQVQFEAPAAHYERGDYWLIPARTATGGVLWPQSRDNPPAPLAIPPVGPTRYLAPLALLKQLPGRPVELRVLFHRVREEQAPPDAPPQQPVRPQSGPSSTTTTAIRPVSAGYLLRSVGTLQAGAAFPIQDGTIIGRSPDAGIYIDHPDISRQHVVFHIVEGGVVMITDLGSRNGTEVNGARLTERVPIPLSPGDTIALGSGELRLRFEVD